MLATYVRTMLGRKARRAGIEKRVHQHGLRHTMATEMRAEGVDIGVIGKQLGHSSIATTATYLDHVAPAAVIEAMRRRTWPATLPPVSEQMALLVPLSVSQ